jgi:hypothetical protein
MGVDSVDQEDTFHKLQQFLLVFIDSTYMPQLEKDVNGGIDEIIKDPDAFASTEVVDTKGKSTAARDVMKCAVDVAEVLERVIRDMFLLPQSMHELLEIADSSLARVLLKCTIKYGEVTSL